MENKDKKRWYIIQTYSGFEDSVERDLKKRIETMEMQDYIFNVLIPTETVVETKADGSKKEKVKKMFPGYIFVEMIVTDESWFIVRNTPKVTGFLGSSGGGTKPVPLPPEEVANVFRKAGIVPEVKLDFEIGDMVEIMTGSFAGQIVEVTDIDLIESKVTVLVDMFGRSMDMQVDITSVRKAK